MEYKLNQWYYHPKASVYVEFFIYLTEYQTYNAKQFHNCPGFFNYSDIGWRYIKQAGGVFDKLYELTPETEKLLKKLKSNNL